jgi:polysaccharide export outer membrane protein
VRRDLRILPRTTKFPSVLGRHTCIGWVLTVAVLTVAVLSTGCGGAGSFVWANQLPPDEVRPTDYVIAAGDVVSVRVFGQEAMSVHAKVRSDGKISVPFLGDVLVAGKPPAIAAQEMEAGLKNFINSPNVTVTVEEFQPVTVTVIGEVGHPGTVPIDGNTSLLQVLASAGGLTENASRDDIFVLREKPVARRIRFTYESLTRAPPQSTFRLRPGDVVVVE